MPNINWFKKKYINSFFQKFLIPGDFLDINLTNMLDLYDLDQFLTKFVVNIVIDLSSSNDLMRILLYRLSLITFFNITIDVYLVSIFKFPYHNMI